MGVASANSKVDYNVPKLSKTQVHEGSGLPADIQHSVHLIEINFMNSVKEEIRKVEHTRIINFEVV